MPLFYDLKKLASMEKPGPEHDLFKQWVLEQDVTLNGIAPAKFSGRGIGIVAERNIEEGALPNIAGTTGIVVFTVHILDPEHHVDTSKADEELVRVPISALLSTDSIVDEVKTAAVSAGISIHGLLAMYLAISGQDEEDPYSSWRRVWPSKEDLNTMPVNWPFSLRGLKKSPAHGTWSPLPPSINGEWSKGAISDVRYAALATSSSRLERQRRKIDKDWTRAKKLCEGRLEYNDYLYHWLIVNTRSFFFDMTEDEVEDRDDKMALCPYIDYFNHSANGCKVGYNEDGYTVTSDRAYLKGEELFVSYGDHDNDLLLADYGFVLEDNDADTVPLDDLVLWGPNGIYKHKNLLADKNYFGDYKVSRADGICWRTQMAAALQLLGNEQWQKVVDGERELTDDESSRIKDFIKTNWIVTWLKEADRALAVWATDEMQDNKDVDENRREVAVTRWRQIQDILNTAT